MRLDEVLDDGQAEPGAALFARAAGVGAVESLEDARQVLGAYPRAGVGHGDVDASPLTRSTDTLMRPPAGVWRKALSNRFVKICRSASGSAVTSPPAADAEIGRAHV